MQVLIYCRLYSFITMIFLSVCRRSLCRSCSLWRMQRWCRPWAPVCRRWAWRLSRCCRLCTSRRPCFVCGPWLGALALWRATQRPSSLWLLALQESKWIKQWHCMLVYMNTDKYIANQAACIQIKLLGMLFRYLASGSGDTTVRFWDLSTETPHHTARGQFFTQLYKIQGICKLNHASDILSIMFYKDTHIGFCPLPGLQMARN